MGINREKGWRVRAARSHIISSYCVSFYCVGFYCVDIFQRRDPSRRAQDFIGERPMWFAHRPRPQISPVPVRP